MYYLYCIIFLMEMTLEIAMTPQTDLGDYMIDGDIIKETLFPINGPAFIHSAYNSHRPTGNLKRKNTINVARRYYFRKSTKKTTIRSLVDIPEWVPKLYDDQLFEKETESPSQSVISTLIYNPEFTQSFDDTVPADTTGTVDINESHLPFINEPNLEANDNIHSTVMGDNINEPNSNLEATVPTTDRTIRFITIPVTKRLVTTPRADIYALFTITRIVIKKLNESLYKQTPKLPSTYMQPTLTTSTTVQGYKLALSKIFGKKITTKHAPIKKKGDHFIDVYDYMDNFSVSIPADEVKPEKIYTTLEPKSSDKLHQEKPSKTPDLKKYIQNKATKERYEQLNRYSMRNSDDTAVTAGEKLQRFRVVGNSDRTHVTKTMRSSITPINRPTVNNALATAIIRFKVPLDKLASMKASFKLNHDYSARAKGVVLNNAYARSLDEPNNKVKKVLIESEYSPQNLRAGYNETRATEMVHTVTESHWISPLIKTASITQNNKLYMTTKQDKVIKNVLATDNEKIQLPLRKLADMKVNFNYEIDYPPNQERDIKIPSKSVNSNVQYSKSTSKVTKQIKTETIKNAKTPGDLNVTYFRTPIVEKVNTISLTEPQSEPINMKLSTTPLIISYLTSKRANDVTNVLATAKQKFKIPLQKLSSMKASFNFGRMIAQKKEKEVKSSSKYKEKSKANTTPTEKAIKKTMKTRELNTAYFRAPAVEKIDKIDVTVDPVLPWIKTVSQTNAHSVYPWIHTKVFPMPESTTSRPTVLYEYKELKPEEVLRIRPETDRFEEMGVMTPKPYQPKVADRFQKKGEDTVTAHEEVGNDPFSIFLVKLMKILGSKKLKDLHEIITRFNQYLTTLLDTGKLMKLGLATGAYVAYATSILGAPIKDLQRQLFIIQISLENRRKMLDEDFNAMLDEMDDAYDVGEEEAMQRVLLEITVHPNGTKTGEQIVRGFIDDVLLHPMNRIAGTAHGNVVFENIAKVAKKNNPPIDKNARRYDKVTNKLSFRENYERRNRGILSEENKFVNPIHTKDLKYNKRDSKQGIIIRSMTDISIEKDLSNNGVEIKIQINNLKQSKSYNDRNVQRNTENNDFRRHPKGGATTHSYSDETNEENKNVNRNVQNKTKVKLQFDCESVPVVTNKKSASKDNKTELIMYCSNASNR